MQILEIGPVPVVKRVYSANTFFINTNPDAIVIPKDRGFNFGLRHFAETMRLLRDEKFDAVFVTRLASQHEAFGAESLIRLLFNRRIASRGIPLFRPYADRLLRFGARHPIVVLDPSDAPFVPRHGVWLWEKARAVFKRELPLDRWRLFMRTAHDDVPTPRFRERGRYRSLIDKVRPMSLGLSLEAEQAIPRAPAEKATDVFFAGLVKANSFVREAGLPELLALRARGVSVDIPEERLPPSEFYRRCRSARLVWSPSGLGHDAFRHYEAGACGSVPVISRPPILQYAPFAAGETAFFYDPEPGGLTRTIMGALENRDRLAAMGQAARAHVLRHHSQKARVDQMLAAAR